MVKKNKNDYVENLSEKAEETAARQDLKMLCDIFKRLRSRYKSGNMPVKDENGNVLSQMEDGESISTVSLIG